MQQGFRDSLEAHIPATSEVETIMVSEWSLAIQNSIITKLQSEPIAQENKIDPSNDEV